MENSKVAIVCFGLIDRPVSADGPSADLESTPCFYWLCWSPRKYKSLLSGLQMVFPLTDILMHPSRCQSVSAWMHSGVFFSTSPQNFPESRSFFSVFSLIFASCCLQVTELRPVKFGYGSKAFRPSRGWLRVLMRTHLRSASSFCVNPALYLLTLMPLSGIASYCTAGRSWIKLIVH